MKNFIKLINNLLEIITFISNGKLYSTVKSIENVSYHVEGRTNSITYNETIANLWIMEKEICNTISKKTFEDYLEKLLIQLYVEERKCENDDYLQFFEKLLKLPNEERVVFNEIYGIKVHSDNVLHFGNYSIYNFTKHKELILQKYPRFDKVQNGQIIKELKSNYLISYPIKTRDHIRAKEIALEKFKLFENILNFFIANLLHFNKVGISEFENSNKRITIVVSENHNTTTIESLNYNKPEILDQLNLDKDESFKKLLFLIEKEEKNEIEQRILNSVDWMTQGLIEKDCSKALIYFTFGIESLLQIKNDIIISPSILSSISDMLALILGSSYNDKLDIIKKFKKIYSKRSAIAHSGSKNVNKSDLHAPFFMIRSLIISFLLNEELLKIENSSQLSDWYLTKKLN